MKISLDWLKDYVKVDVPLPRLLDRLTMIGLVAERWTYGALIDTVRRTAGGLRALGLGRGDRILLRLPDLNFDRIKGLSTGILIGITDNPSFIDIFVDRCGVC